MPGKAEAAHPVRPSMCGTCIFRDPANRLDVGPERMAEIQGYLLRGQNHVCHKEQLVADASRFTCRGGRDFQLTMFHRLGYIDAPTDEALAAARDAIFKKVNCHGGK